MTAGDRFAVILLAITVVASVLGWLMRSLWSTQADVTRANTAALSDLTAAVSRLDGRMSRMEGRMQGRRHQ